MADTLTTIHLVRHGEVHNPGKVLYGRLDGYHLSAKGQAMAQVVADTFAAEHHDVAAVISSPLLRAQETAAPIAAVYHLPVALDDRLIEAGNEFEGTTVGANPKQLLNPKFLRLLTRQSRLLGMPMLNPFRPSWGEAYFEQVARMRAAILAARDANLGREAVLVSHQLPIWVTRLAIEGKHLWHDPRRRECTTCSITSLIFPPGSDRPAVEYREPARYLSQTLSADGWSVR